MSKIEIPYIHGNKREYGANYQGSKRKLSRELIEFMKSENPNAKYFVDVFGGGGAMSFEALHHFDHVFYNDKNKGVSSLLEEVFTKGMKEEYYHFISREEFFSMQGLENDMGGLIDTTWSFGGRQKTYLYGKDIEEQKKLLHNVVLYDCKNSRVKLNEILNISIPEIKKQNTLFGEEGVKDRRLRIYKSLREQNKRLDLQHLETINHLERIAELKVFRDRLTFSSLDYIDFKTATDPSETIYYLDPPYLGTSGYKNDLDHVELLRWAKEQQSKVYVSSYEFEGLELVYIIEHLSTLSSSRNAKKVLEKLFTIKKS